MYLDHYKLTEKPFQITTDPKFLWLGEKHQEALAMLKYAVLDGKGFLLLTGDVGTGKTTLINALVQDLQENVIVATVTDPSLEPSEFYEFLGTAFGIEGNFARKVDFRTNFERFLKVAHANGKKVLLIVDEAQRLTNDLLEEIRLLSNIERADAKLINIFFIGQNEFRKDLEAPECRALRQRIAFTHHLNTLTVDETLAYIRHRLRVSGTEKEIFTAEAVREIYAFSQGYPRLINIMCDHALLTGYVRNVQAIDARIIEECARELAVHREVAPEEVKVAAHCGRDFRRRLKKAGLYGLLVLAMAFCGYLVLAAGYNDAVRNMREFYGRLIRGPEADMAVPETRETAAMAPEQQVVRSPISSLRLTRGDEDGRSLQPGAGERNLEQTATDAGENADANIRQGKNTEPSVTSSQGREERESRTNQRARETLFPEGKLVIPFSYGMAKIPEGAFDALDRLAARMAEDSDILLVVKGYTDTLGDSSSNETLGQLRATAVQQYLIARGISPLRIDTLGMGEQNPRATNATPTGRAANRRVEIELKR